MHPKWIRVDLVVLHGNRNKIVYRNYMCGVKVYKPSDNLGESWTVGYLDLQTEAT